MKPLRTYPVSARDREPLLAFILKALRDSGCRIIFEPEPHEAPFRITFETPQGERFGIIAYAFLATFTPTKNRPKDEHSFQVKYGSKDGELHELWQDPYGLYTTLFLGINPSLGFFVAADPTLHNPTKFFIRIEFKDRHVNEILSNGWYAWERQKRASQVAEPVEVLVGGTADRFLHYVRFEREALGEDQGHRQLLAEKLVSSHVAGMIVPATSAAPIPQDHVHALASEFELSPSEVLDLIAGTRRLKMAVRGWVAEEHLVRQLRSVPGVSDCERLFGDREPDIALRFEGSRRLYVECKNVLRQTTANGLARIDFQRTRAAKSDPCSRYYSPDDFDVLAACLHAVRERWEFCYALSRQLDPYGAQCPGKLASNVRIDGRWSEEAKAVLRAAAAS